MSCIRRRRWWGLQVLRAPWWAPAAGERVEIYGPECGYALYLVSMPPEAFGDDPGDGRRLVGVIADSPADALIDAYEALGVTPVVPRYRGIEQKLFRRQKLWGTSTLTPTY